MARLAWLVMPKIVNPHSVKVSIITVVYNNDKTISDAIESVINQSYQNIEYIVIDGASTDGTFEIIKNYSDKVTKIVSEPDKGIYDGLNKGILLATGDVLALLHSDDIYENKHVISNDLNPMRT